MHPGSPLVVVTGPTAAGKSSLAVDLARVLGGEIVSADSMQVYRLLDIGTAKPSAADRAKVPHHLVDYVDPAETYNAGRFIADAKAAIQQLRSRRVVPVVCGGTALYLQALFHGLAPGPGRDPTLREQLESRWDAGQRLALWEELQRADPDLASRLHPNDRSRIIRGLEVWSACGRPLSQLQAEHRTGALRYDALWIGVGVDRPELYRRIDERVVRMMAAGWVAEVQGVLEQGYTADIPPLRAIGYRQICGYLSRGGELSGVISEIQKQTRHFAKRQLTWFRRMPLHWHTPTDVSGVIARARKYLQSRPSTI